MKAGYIYVLTHPSMPDQYKVGMTTQLPEKRLSQHNTNFKRPAGRIVKETGKKWELKEFHKVEDAEYAESIFWGYVRTPDLPQQARLEIDNMTLEQLQEGLRRALKAGESPAKLVASIEPANYVYANSARIRRRLEGRDITLLTYVKSRRSGKADFKCSNQHVWRSTPDDVGMGDGCPVCGLGLEDPDVVDGKIRPGYVLLLVNPKKPREVKVELRYGNFENCVRDESGEDWEIHHYRYTEEMELAEEVIWDMLGKPLPHHRSPIYIELVTAEDAFRKLVYEVVDRVAESEKRLETQGIIPRLKPLGRKR